MKNRTVFLLMFGILFVGVAAIPVLNHDTLDGFETNEHIDWTGASVDLMTSGNVKSGTADTTAGVLKAYGAGAGSTDGGCLQLHTAADYDTTIDVYQFNIDEDDLVIKQGTTTKLTLSGATGNFTFASAVTAPSFSGLGDVLDDLNILGANPFSGDPAADFLVGTSAGTLAWQSGATARTSMGLGTGDSPAFTGLTIDTDTLIVDAVNDRVGIGTSSPDSVFHIKANIAGSVGSHSAGQIIIQNPTDSVFSNVVITGYESDGNGDPDQQLWYLGSSSSGNTDIIFLNRRNAKLALGTSGTSRLTILGNGNVGINVTDPDAKLEVVGTLHVSDTATFDGTLTGGELQVDDINIDGTTITGGSGEDSFHLVHSAGGSIQFDNNVDGLEATFTGTGVFGHTAAIGGGIVEAIAGGSEDPHTPVYVDNYCNNIARNSALYFRKSLSDTIGTKTDTSAGTDIGSIFFFGVDNTQAFDHGARIFVEQEGAIGTRVPTRFQFQTSTSTTPFITGIKIDPAGEVFMPQVYNDDVGAISGTDRDLLIDPNGQLGYDSSSARYKENIRDLTGSERIYDLRPRLYNRIGLEEDEAGLIAEEVELTMPEVVSYKTERVRTYLPTYDPNDPLTADHFTEEVITTNQPETVVKSKLIVPMLKEIQILKAEINSLKARVTELERR